MEFIDTHSHLFAEEYSDDLKEVIDRAKEVGVSKICMPNIDCSSIEAMLKISGRYKGYCYSMIGLHPTSVEMNYREQLNEMRHLLHAPNEFVGIGEVGLDFYWDKTYLRQQLDAFHIQLQWALEYQLPLIIHCRDAFEEMVDLMQPYIKEASLRGIFHSFAGTEKEAEKLLQFSGFKLGINGIVTFKKSSLPLTLKMIPLARLVLETDSPYLAPAPNRGKRNESANVKEVGRKLSEIYGLTIQEVADITTRNALEVFRLT